MFVLIAQGPVAGKTEASKIELRAGCLVLTRRLHGERKERLT